MTPKRKIKQCKLWIKVKKSYFHICSNLVYDSYPDLDRHQNGKSDPNSDRHHHYFFPILIFSIHWREQTAVQCVGGRHDSALMPVFSNQNAPDSVSDILPPPPPPLPPSSPPPLPPPSPFCPHVSYILRIRLMYSKVETRRQLSPDS